MSYAQATARNRINPLSVSTVEQTTAPYVTYDQVELCAEPNCPVCRAQRSDKRYKHHKRHRHHHRKHKTNFWNGLLPRVESAGSTVSVHSIELDDRRSHYNSHVTERALVPVDRTDRQIVSSTTRTRRLGDEEVMRDAWTPNRTSDDDEIVCCRASNGCRCPCWCCIILIILFVILIIVLIVLLATLL